VPAAIVRRRRQQEQLPPAAQVAEPAEDRHRDGHGERAGREDPGHLPLAAEVGDDGRQP